MNQTERWSTVGGPADHQKPDGQICQSGAAEPEQEILDRFWSAGDDLCLGFNDGYYVGRPAVEHYYRAVEARNLLVAKTLQRSFPSSWGTNPTRRFTASAPSRWNPCTAR